MSDPRRRIAVMGEALVDLVAQDEGLYAALPGGSGFNTALALARHGCEVAFCGTLSRDRQGARLASRMEREGVSLAGVARSEKPSPIVLVDAHAATGEPAYSLHVAGTALEDEPAWRDLPVDLAHVHATSFASTTGAGGAAALAALAAARGRAGTSFDPNIRPALLPDRETAVALVNERVALADIVKASEEDLRWLCGGADPGSLIGAWADLGVGLVIVTRGAAGASAFSGGRRIDVASPQVIVKDCVAAGDTFMAAFLSCLAEENRLGSGLCGAGDDELARWLSFAARAAAVTCSRVGADPPRRKDLIP